jgi:hypothetical protein
MAIRTGRDRTAKIWSQRNGIGEQLKGNSYMSNSNIAISELQRILAIELKEENEHALLLLAYGLQDASNVQKQVGHMYHNSGVRNKEFREILERLSSALNKVAKQTADLAGNQSRIRQKLNKLRPAGWLSYFDTLDKQFYNKYEETLYDHDSQFEHLALNLETMPAEQRIATAHELAELVNLAIEDLTTPGRGNARQSARHYIAGIQTLMKWFSETYPDSPISSKRETKFWKYSQIWLNSCEEENFSDCERHIKNAIENLKGWKKLHL